MRGTLMASAAAACAGLVGHQRPCLRQEPQAAIWHVPLLVAAQVQPHATCTGAYLEKTVSSYPSVRHTSRLIREQGMPPRVVTSGKQAAASCGASPPSPGSRPLCICVQGSPCKARFLPGKGALPEMQRGSLGASGRVHLAGEFPSPRLSITVPVVLACQYLNQPVTCVGWAVETRPHFSMCLTDIYIYIILDPAGACRACTPWSAHHTDTAHPGPLPPKPTP